MDKYLVYLPGGILHVIREGCSAQQEEEGKNQTQRNTYHRVRLCA